MLAFLIIFDIICLTAYAYGNLLIPWKLFLLANAGAIAVAYMLYMIINRKIIRDLSHGHKIVRTAVVSDKFWKTDYEWGSGILFLPIFGHIFPKIWGQKMNPYEAHFLVVDNVRYKTQAEIFEKAKKGEEIEMHYTQLGNNFLGFSIIE